MTLDPHSGVPLHKQLAGLLRDRIAAGEWPPGGLLPAQARIGYDYAVGKATVQAAITALRSEGLIDVERGIGIRVREPVEVQMVRVPRGGRVRSRMPTPEERADLDMPEGVPVLVVSYGGRTQVYAADRTELSHS